jgi:hypothetical protein
VARVSVASVCRSTASSFSVADFCSSALLIHASCCQLSRVLISYGGSSLSRDRCFSAGSFSCVTNWTPSEGLQFSSAVFHFQAPHSSCLALGLGILFSWFPTRFCDFWHHQALQSARFQRHEARTKAFSPADSPSQIFLQSRSPCRRVDFLAVDLITARVLWFWHRLRSVCPALAARLRFVPQ